jgi:hypothetical protein
MLGAQSAKAYALLRRTLTSPIGVARDEENPLLKKTAAKKAS